MLSVEESAPKTHLILNFVKKLAPSLRQLLNEQQMRRISGLQKFEVRFGNWNVGNFCKIGMEVCEHLRE